MHKNNKNGGYLALQIFFLHRTKKSSTILSMEVETAIGAVQTPVAGG